MMKTTSLEYEEHGEWYRMTVKYGIDYTFAKVYQQSPYFSLTADIRRRAGNGRWVEWAGGACHDEIAKRFPALADLVQWHLVSTEEPLYYLANAKYWWEKVNGVSKWPTQSYEKPLENFKSTIIWGSIPEDTEPELQKFLSHNGEPGFGWGYVARALVDRLPRVMAKFREKMKDLGVGYTLLSEAVLP